MPPLFTADEKRFLLSEAIKASQVDLIHLVEFIKVHGIEPDWLNMSLPYGRTANQCIEVAHSLSIPTSNSLKRKLSNSSGEQYTERLPAPPPTTLGILEQGLDSPYRLDSTGPYARTTYPPHAADINPPMQIQQDKPKPKKRGRPSRADKAKKDLRPMLPLAPRPPQVSIHPPHGAAGGASTLPTISPTPSAKTMSPVTAHRMSTGSLDSQIVQIQGRPVSADGDISRPRILADGFSADFTREGRTVLPSPYTLSRDQRTSSSAFLGADTSLLKVDLTTRDEKFEPSRTRF